MSAVAWLHPETSRVSRTCQILILCEDFAAYGRAAETSWRILVQLADGLDFSFKSWNFMELADPAIAQAAGKSDIILLSLQGADLPAAAADWLDALAEHRLRAEGVLALVLDEPAGSPEAVAKLVARLQGETRCQARPVPAGTATATATFSSCQMTDHWGLNE